MIVYEIMFSYWAHQATPAMGSVAGFFINKARWTVANGLNYVGKLLELLLSRVKYKSRIQGII